MVQLHNFFFFITSMVMPYGTAVPILLKWFVSRDVPTGAPFSNGTMIPILIPSFIILVYLHSRKFIRSMDGAKSGVLVRASCPILLPDIIGRSSSETRARNALFHFVPVLHFLLLESKGDFSYLESFCDVLRLLFFHTFFSLPRDRSVKRERARRRKGQTLRPNGNEQRRNDKRKCPRHPHLERRVEGFGPVSLPAPLHRVVLWGVCYQKSGLKLSPYQQCNTPYFCRAFLEFLACPKIPGFVRQIYFE